MVLVRYNYSNNTAGTEVQRTVVPCNMGQKEKYIQALQGDPTNDNKIGIKLPLIAYDLVSVEYDDTRKLQTAVQNYNIVGSGASSQYNPVPWNLNFEVYIYVRTIEDGTQIIEQILPYFTPNYTLVLNLVPTMNIQKDIPVVLNKATYEVLNEGEATNQESRNIIWTLSFTAKAYIYGPVSTSGLIKEAIVGIYNWLDVDGQNLYMVMQSGGTGNYLPSETVYQGSVNQPTATAQVVDWSNTTNRLLITNATGLFYTNTPLIGALSGTSYSLINYEIKSAEIEQITLTATSANANPLTYTTNKIYFDTAI